MRIGPCLAIVALLAGCNGSTGTLYGTTAPEPASALPTRAVTEARVTRWEQQWQDAKREVVEARDTARDSPRPIAPELDAEVTELLDRDLESQNPEERISKLQNAVDDALRLAELVSIG
jgi:hypothetical protein